MLVAKATIGDNMLAVRACAGVERPGAIDRHDLLTFSSDAMPGSR